jgi:hypothetical protein
MIRVFSVKYRIYLPSTWAISAVCYLSLDDCDYYTTVSAADTFLFL